MGVGVTLGVGLVVGVAVALEVGVGVAVVLGVAASAVPTPVQITAKAEIIARVTRFNSLVGFWRLGWNTAQA